MTDFRPFSAGHSRRLAARIGRRITRLVDDLPTRIERWRGNPKLRATFLRRVGYRPDLKNPRTFNEKIQVRKLRDRNPLYPIISDKIRMRGHVARVIGRAEACALCVPLLTGPDRFWLGELTCYTSGGFLPWTPRSFDEDLGAMWAQRLHDGRR